MDNETIIKTPKKLEILSKINEKHRTYFKWFLALTEIPHPTFHCFELSQAIQKWLTSMGAKFEADSNGNILIHIDSNGMADQTPTLGVQAHIDMVWVGDYVDGVIDVELKDGKLIAEKSTLGADDGFGVAMILEIVEKRNELIHGPLELILTIDEEMGLIGMKQMPAKDGSTKTNIPILKSKYLINCDSLNGDNVYVGSQGGTVYQSSFVVNPVKFSNNPDKSIIQIQILNCSGGHSGQCITFGRANAIKNMGILLSYLLSSNIEFEIAEFDGGEKVNIIAPSCKAIIIISSSDESNALEILNKHSQALLNEFQTTDNANYEIKKIQYSDNLTHFLPSQESKKLVNFITLCPSGVMRMSPLFPTIPEISNNFSQIHLKHNENKVHTELFSRSLTKLGIDIVDQILKTAYSTVGLEVVENIWLVGVPWEANINSKLAKLMTQTFEELHHQKKEISALSVNIEPPELLELGYDIDMISICPSIPKAHMIGEFIDVNETIQWKEAVYKLFQKIVD